jgi:Bifunctional DNA primase/polymerase, N-terminal
MNVMDAALCYIARGWSPIPVQFRSKKPIGQEWQKLRLNATTALAYFNGKQLNIGLILGPGGLTDADLDCSEAIALAPYILPPTPAIFGRETARDSHWLYVTSIAADDPDIGGEITYDDPDPDGGGRMAELRIGGSGKGAQTVAPPSVHKDTGEVIAWSKQGDPAKVDGADLRKRISDLAACCILARSWPQGDKVGCHERARIVGGIFARSGYTPSRTRLMVEAVAKAAGRMDRWKELSRTAEDAVKEFQSGGRTYGYPTLAEAIGEKRAKKVCEWLGYSADKEAVDDMSPAGASVNAKKSSPGIGDFSWDCPDESRLVDLRGPLPELPLDLLPPRFADWCAQAAMAIGCTPAHVIACGFRRKRTVIPIESGQ